MNINLSVKSKIFAIVMIFAMLFTMLPMTTFAGESQKSLEVSKISESNFENDKDASFEFSVENKGQSSKLAYLLNALYEKDSNRMITYNYIKKEIGPNEKIDWGSMLPIPELGDYYVKSFIWNEMKNPDLISNSIKINMGEKPIENPNYKAILAGLNQYIMNNNPIPEIGSIGGEWVVIGLARNNDKLSSDYIDTYYNKVVNIVKNEEQKNSRRWSNKVTEVERVILALTAIGKDASNVDGVNLYKYIWNKADNFPGLTASQCVLGGRQGANELIFGLIALDSYNAEKPDFANITRNEIINKLIDVYQKKDGFFALDGKEGTADIDITAMSVQALAKYYNTNNKVKDSIDKAIIALSEAQSNSGGYLYGSMDSKSDSAEALCQVLVALSAVGIDADKDSRFIKNNISILDALLEYYDEDTKGFEHVKNSGVNEMASEQALYALTAYDRYKSNKKALYDMTDVEMEAVPDKNVYATSIDLNKTELILEVGQSETLSVSFNPVNTTETELTWYIEEENGVASVDANGKITAIKEGTANVYVSAETKKENNNKVLAVCVLTVKPEEQENPIGKVKMSVEKRTCGKGDVISLEEVELYEGDTAWDVFTRVMENKNIPFESTYNEKFKSVYISSIDGDGEFDHGQGSGWSYQVNGEFPEVGASFKTLNVNDVIRWRYCITPIMGELKAPLNKYLKEVIEETERLDTDKYTEESIKVLTDVLAEAKIIANNEEYNSKETEKELVVSTYIGNINNAVKGLVKDSNYKPVPADIPEDFKNDCWLNKYFHKMKVGTTYDIKARRVPEIIDNPMNNNVGHPEYIYEIVDGDSIALDNNKITAVKEGISVVKVTYKEITYERNYFPACSPINAAYMIVDVTEGEPTETSISTSITERPAFDTIYYTEGDTTPYTFTVENDSASAITVTCNGKVAQSQNNSYTVNLENRSNVIIISSTENGKTENLGYVIDARKIEYTVKNLTNPGEEIRAKDEIGISFKGIVMPVYKLATIYNPVWTAKATDEYPKSDATAVLYDNDILGEVRGACDQWDLATRNTIKVTFTEAGTYKFTNGRIHGEWWGLKLGSHMNAEGPGEPNLNSPVLKDLFSSMPDIEIEVNSAIITEVSGITLNKTEANLNLDEELQLTANILPENATDKTVTWESSNENIATVDNTGKIIGKSEGTVIVTVTTKSGNHKATCEVTVKKISVSSVELSSSVLTIGNGETVQLEAIIVPTNAYNKNVIWTTSDAQVAKVDVNGNVKAVGIGEAIISVETEDNSKIASCKVQVSENVIHVTKIELNKSEIKLTQSNKFNLIANISPENATVKNISWKSEDETIATVNDEGEVTAVGVGQTKITATTEDGNKIANCVVVVENYATSVQKSDLLAKITEAKLIENTHSYAWNILQLEIAEAENVYNNTEKFLVEVDKATQNLSESITNFNKSKGDFAYTVDKTLEGNNVKVTITFPNIKIPSFHKEIHDIRIKYDSNINGMPTISTENLKENKEGIRTLIFNLSRDYEGTVILQNGRIYESYEYYVSPQFHMPDDTTYYKDQMPDIRINFPLDLGSDVQVSDVQLNKQVSNLEVGKSETLIATIAPENATNKKLTWESDNEEVATVKNGVVTAVAKGNANITVRTDDGNKTATFSVEVTEKTSTEEISIEIED